ncbi:hypothetical protein Psed_0869 [Pseudonocardia dioxanivorans CB1190]|uniref:4Fe-4S Wbl-type domain-containing protein n=1 Tax=Pseudonocardia dioxanivorans (strain ATCC 55486 / DSM 44775 / JCM 13855 / CB1190) TaxID=675635 RepID=F4CSE9_PSEUX|nr:hypothetical protein [Pseudonocardia dioxanivorans]AEA23123.1 hypothetical protein Psed_0869 [Pseudonocardia dioxanivorans CB1190]
MPRADEPTLYTLSPNGPLVRLYQQPDLPCRTRVGDFDIDAGPDETPDERVARIAAACRTCRACPAIELCEAGFAELPPRFQQGVWAGQARGVSARTTRAIAQLEDAS